MLTALSKVVCPKLRMLRFVALGEWSEDTIETLPVDQFPAIDKVIVYSWVFDLL